MNRFLMSFLEETVQATAPLLSGVEGKYKSGVVAGTPVSDMELVGFWFHMRSGWTVSLRLDGDDEFEAVVWKTERTGGVYSGPLVRWSTLGISLSGEKVGQADILMRGLRGVAAIELLEAVGGA